MRVRVHHDPAAQLPGQTQIAVVQVQPFRGGIMLHGYAQFGSPAQHHSNVNR